METYIAILRGINVSGKNKILMAELKDLLETLQFSQISTYIQSGNIVFQYHANSNTLQLATTIEEAISLKYGYRVPVIVLCLEELQQTIERNSFLTDPTIDPTKLHVTFLATPPSTDKIALMSQLSFLPDKFYIIDKQVYLHCPINYGETKLSNQFFENKLKVKATTRNWNTTLKLLEIATMKKGILNI
jgi:uncharacterized protein (DUF1697 family)